VRRQSQGDAGPNDGGRGNGVIGDARATKCRDRIGAEGVVDRGDSLPTSFVSLTSLLQQMRISFIRNHRSGREIFT
jgi:hypothetical protein